MDTKHWEFVKYIAGLSERQLHVAKYIFDGYDNQRIAKKLGISPNTVRTHVCNICRKFKVRGRAELILSILRITDHLRNKSEPYRSIRLPYHDKEAQVSLRRKRGRPRSKAKTSPRRLPSVALAKSGRRPRKKSPRKKSSRK